MLSIRSVRSFRDIRPSRFGGRRDHHRIALRGSLLAGLGLALIACLSTAAAAVGVPDLPSGFTGLARVSGLAEVAQAAGFGQAKVGSGGSAGILLPTNQRITPLGHRLLVNDGRLLSSSISPNGTYLAALTWKNATGFLTVINLRKNTVVQQVGTGAGKDHRIGDGTVAADGPLWSSDGRTLWFPQTADLVRFTVASSGKVSHPVVTKLQTTHGKNPATADLPSGMALSKDGHSLYVALNGANRLGVISTSTGRLSRTIAVGNAPRQVVVVGKNAFVSNEGGRLAKPGQFTNQSDGTAVVASSVTGAATSGTVSEVNLSTGKELKEIAVGLEPTAEYLAADGTLMVANSNDDSLSLIDPASAKVVRTVNVNPLPGSSVGSYPNAITMPNGRTLLVSIGRDNALAVYSYSGAKVPVKYVGLLPTDFYPVAAAYDSALKKVVVTNDKGIGSRGPQTTVSKGPGTSPAATAVTGHNTYNDTGTITSFAMPSTAAIGKDTHQVFVDDDWEHALTGAPVTTSSAAPVAIPARLGDPSTIKHVFLIVKENRTYDQVLGDIGKGDSEAALAQFGARVTPNEHSLARTFGLFDNFYDEGTLSADGHNWLMQADANDYLEKEFGAFYRGYPAQGGDALAYQRDGFLWNAAQAAGNTVQDYGEYNNFVNQATPVPTWGDYYRDAQIMEGTATGPLPVPESSVHTYADIPSLNAIDDHEYPGFDLGIPDQYRVDVWKQSFDAAVEAGTVADLNLIWMPDDHTAGVGTGDPNPVAEVADNDLAVGRVIDTISHSKYWSSSAVFVLEDDTQNGVDHVDGHRAPLLVASPYARRGIVDDTYYSQLNVVATIERILRIAPMNQEDRAAEPMFDAFTDTAGAGPFAVKPNQIPLTQGLTTTSPSGVAEPATGGNHPVTPDLVPKSPAALGIPAAEQPVYRKWVDWSRNGRLTGAGAVPDWVNPAQLNRVDWYSSHDWTTPYPGDHAVLAPEQVPGHELPPGYLGDG